MGALEKPPETTMTANPFCMSATYRSRRCPALSKYWWYGEEDFDTRMLVAGSAADTKSIRRALLNVGRHLQGGMISLESYSAPAI